MITILNVPVAPAGAFATSGGGGGKPWNMGLIMVKGYLKELIILILTVLIDISSNKFVAKWR